MKVSLFLCGRQFHVFFRFAQEVGCVPVALARRKTVLEVIDSESRALALSTLSIRQYNVTQAQVVVGGRWTGGGGE